MHHADIIPLIVGLLIFLSSLISLRLGLSVAIIEIVLGATAGSLGLKTEEWMSYLATFGGILLTFLAGTEIDVQLMKDKFKESFLIGSFSFAVPFVGFSYLPIILSGGASMRRSLPVSLCLPLPSPWSTPYWWKPA